MTPGQTQFYWNLWARCCKANGWGSEYSRPAQFRSELHKQVHDAADQIARAEHRGIELNDLRYGAHRLAFGQPLSSKKIATNKMFDRIKALLLQLIDPDNLSAVMASQHPEDALRRRLTFACRQLAPDAYIAAISADVFGTRNWEGLDLVALRKLSMTLRSRKQHREAPIETAKDDNCPF